MGRGMGENSKRRWFDRFEEAIANGNGDGDRKGYMLCRESHLCYFNFLRLCL